MAVVGVVEVVILVKAYCSNTSSNGRGGKRSISSEPTVLSVVPVDKLSGQDRWLSRSPLRGTCKEEEGMAVRKREYHFERNMGLLRGGGDRREVGITFEM